ncbi:MULTISPECIES: 1-aminocyclopropane-1-carboxylate deaminase/D-cysteine desulfhydrase [Pseudoalteromonas]|uniref:1-aminocyclopropane-1-carboxylate deaminase/D-cysteine desulfhydrase n=1 Tax=Pseudoalteromonas TaxID=53246 RepID=UPI00030E6448|nr:MULTISPECIES: pyridoxal-phosphate dependent enzyme [Pseudoalteromonas]MCF6144262.1 1-aminocyclopropane-1-carboxylate deaminase [Pseudoalteromonas mariniglutinosa NCIMB 1770]
MNLLAESALQKITCPLLSEKKISLSVKRDDQLHPLISGNKWRKLKYNLMAMQAQGKTELVTFGGAFSNHIHACAAAGKHFNIKTHGIIRGPELDWQNPTLQFAKQCGMQLHPVTRLEYRERQNPDYFAQLQARFPNAYILPEGGTNKAALQGCSELAKSLPQADFVICPTGSGGTLAGLTEGCDNSTQILGVAVLKQAEYLINEIKSLSPIAAQQQNWQLLTQFHDGGYGKFSSELWQFCLMMQSQHQLPLEPIYSGKMMYALWQLIEQDYFPEGSRIIAIHTGGLQGLDGLRYRQLI